MIALKVVGTLIVLNGVEGHLWFVPKPSCKSRPLFKSGTATLCRITTLEQWMAECSMIYSAICISVNPYKRTANDPWSIC